MGIYSIYSIYIIYDTGRPTKNGGNRVESFISNCAVTTTMTSKRELEEQLDLQKQINAKQEKLLGMKKTVTSKISAGTNFVPICKVAGITASFMPTSDKYPVPSIWISKNGRQGMAIPATKTGMDSLVAVVAEVLDKAELTA